MKSSEKSHKASMNNFDKEYNKWIELCYEDILNVQNKYEKVKLN